MLLQFLVEAVVLACLGGVIGLLLALIASWVIAPLMQVPFLFDVRINAWPSFLGVDRHDLRLFPGAPAASLNPIDALRHE